MALPLILRSANKMQGYPCMLRCTSFAFTNTGNFGHVSNTNSVFKDKKITPTILNKQILTTTPVRSMAGEGDHRLLWTVERLLSLGLLGLLPVTIAMPNALCDNAAAVAIVLHFHWGIEAMAEDYLRPIIVGSLISSASAFAVYIISGVTLGGLLYFNFSDIGIGKAIRRIWSIKP